MSTTKWFPLISRSILSSSRRRLAQLLTVSLVSGVLAYSQATTKIVAAYYQPAFSTNTLITQNSLSHLNYLIYAFGAINGNGGCDASQLASGTFAQITALKQKNPNLKVLISLGGATAGTVDFITYSQPGAVAPFVSQCVKDFVGAGKFDGIDIDWEVPGPSDQGNYNNLLSTFRQTLGKNGILTAAILPSQGASYSGESDIDFVGISTITTSSNGRTTTTTPPGAAASVSFFNVMAYNYAGTWSGADTSNAPLPHIQSDIDALVTQGAPASKLVLGIPFYGVQYSGFSKKATVTSMSSITSLLNSTPSKTISSDSTDPSYSKIASTIASARVTTYYPTLTQQYTGQAASLTSNNAIEWGAWAYVAGTTPALYNFDNATTIPYKAKWALARTATPTSSTAQPLAGVVAWDLSQDDPKTTLLCAMETAMAQSATSVCVPAPTTTTLYDFETGTAAWTYSGGISGIGTSTAEHATGTHSLSAVSSTGSSAAQGLVFVPVSGLAQGGTVTFHVWVSTNSKLTSVEPFISNSSYAWTTSATTTFTAGAWTTYSIKVPANAIEIGVSFDSAAGFTGDVYIDDVTYTTP